MEQDVERVAWLGLKAYRFSIAWSRLLPLGRGPVNKAGIDFYSRLIDLLLEKKIEPWPTLFHWDLPLTLQFEQDGLMNPAIADAFVEYADLCFHHFGDRVQHWLTFNEPYVYAMFGHGFGIMAPGRISRQEPYLVAHHQLLAHAAIVERYREKYQPRQKGAISAAFNCDWREPLTAGEEDRRAAERALEFYLGWFADPIYHGDYPESMKSRLGKRLPAFTREQRERVQGAADFFALNHYTTLYAAHSNDTDLTDDPYNNGGYANDQLVVLSSDPEWKKTEMGWNIVPAGLTRLLHWIDRRYHRPDIHITENGCACPDQVVGGRVDDGGRIAYLQGYIDAAHQALDEGVRLKSYFVWSLLDNFEWALGFSMRFGLFYIDYDTCERIPKASASWYRDVIRNNGLGVE